VKEREGERTRHTHILASGYSFSLFDLPSKSHMKMLSFQNLIASDLHYKFSERCRRSTLAYHRPDEVCICQPTDKMKQEGHTVKHRPSADPDLRDIPTISKSPRSLHLQLPYPQSTWFLAGAQFPRDTAYQAIDPLLIRP